MTRTPVPVVLATTNPGKQRELAALLAPLGVELRLASEFGIASAPESGSTFEANAEQKARYVAERSGLPALADDSGLEVDALGGRPGVYSARYAGLGASDAENNALLLAELTGVPPQARGGRYRCVLALLWRADDAAPLFGRGAWEGRIATAPAGSGGFGYDPLFVPEGYSQTVGELAPELKQALSHRAHAARDLLARVGTSGIWSQSRRGIDRMDDVND
jgi:XTP/dITP diphosphohydrolase